MGADFKDKISSDRKPLRVLRSLWQRQQSTGKKFTDKKDSPNPLANLH
jgi:hypothetical protein